MMNEKKDISTYAIPGILISPSPNSIIAVVEQKTGVNIKLKTRKREIVEARQIAMYVIKHRTRLSLATIGELCGNKDHTTVLHTCKTVAPN